MAHAQFPPPFTPTDRADQERRTGRAFLVACVALVIAVAGIAFLAVQWQSVKSDVDDLVAAQEDKADTEGELRDQLAGIETALATLTQAVEADQGSLSVTADAIGRDIAALADRIKAVAACVDVYMDTISQWSNDITQGYEYRYCS